MIIFNTNAFREARMAQKQHFRDIGKALGKDFSAISLFESGKQKVSLKNLKMYMSYLGLSAKDFFFRNEVIFDEFKR